jgi:hypothetical protein
MYLFRFNLCSFLSFKEYVSLASAIVAIIIDIGCALPLELLHWPPKVQAIFSQVICFARLKLHWNRTLFLNLLDFHYYVFWKSSSKVVHMKISSEILCWVSRLNFNTLNFCACPHGYLQTKVDHFLHGKSIFWGTSMDSNLSQIKLLLNSMTRFIYVIII